MTATRHTSKWTTRDGAKVRICDMGDQHLLRTIAMLRRDGVQLLVEGYGLEILPASAEPLFAVLVAEAKQRGLRAGGSR